MAALHRLRLAGNGTRVALVASAEAAAQFYPLPSAFEMEAPVLRVGDDLDVAAFGEIAEHLGYVADDRVDEPGEVAVRGQVVDIFPADAECPARIEVAEGRIVALRSYDPITQLGTGDLDRLEIGRSTEPPLGDDPVTLFDHLADAAVALDPGADRRRDRYVALCADAARGRLGQRAEPAADAGRWTAALTGQPVLDVAPGDEANAMRFVEGRSPLRGFVGAVEAAIAAGDRVVVAGLPRDIRFLARQLRKAKVDVADSASWAAAMVAGAATTLAMPIDRGWTLPGLMVVAAADVIGGRALTPDTTVAAVNPLLDGAGGIRLARLGQLP